MMQNRSKLLMGATALLYFGPLLAGLGGFGWNIVYAFTAIFVLWLIIMKPQQFPRTLADWQRPEVLIRALGLVVVQILLVALCFGVGRGIGGALGTLPPFPMMLPLAISFLAIPLARMLWDPWKAEAMDKMLDEAIVEINGAPKTMAQKAEQLRFVAGMVDHLNALPDDTSNDELLGHLAALRDQVDEAYLFQDLLSRVQDTTASDAGHRALALMASDGGTIERNLGHNFPVKAVQAMENSPTSLIALFATRLTTALETDDDLLGDCPNAGLLDSLAQKHPEANAEVQKLSALTARLMAELDA